MILGQVNVLVRGKLKGGLFDGQFPLWYMNYNLGFLSLAWGFRLTSHSLIKKVRKLSHSQIIWPYLRYLISRMVQYPPHFRWLLKLRVTAYFVSMKFAFSHIAWWIFSYVPRRPYRSLRKAHPDKNKTPGNLRSDEMCMRFMKSIPTYGLINSEWIIWIGWLRGARRKGVRQIPYTSYFINETLLPAVFQQRPLMKKDPPPQSYRPHERPVGYLGLKGQRTTKNIAHEIWQQQHE